MDDIHILEDALHLFGHPSFHNHYTFEERLLYLQITATIVCCNLRPFPILEQLLQMISSLAQHSIEDAFVQAAENGHKMVVECLARLMPSTTQESINHRFLELFTRFMSSLDQNLINSVFVQTAGKGNESVVPHIASWTPGLEQNSINVAVCLTGVQGHKLVVELIAHFTPGPDQPLITFLFENACFHKMSMAESILLDAVQMDQITDSHHFLPSTSTDHINEI
jgi:hypothetical protein